MIGIEKNNVRDEIVIHLHIIKKLKKYSLSVEKNLP